MFRVRRWKYYLETCGVLMRELKPTYPLLLKKLGLRFKISRLTDVLAIKEVVLDGDYEKGAVVVEKKDKVIVDVGGGIGDFAIMAAKKSAGTVFVFEPDKKSFRVLTENVKLNGLKNVRAFKAAVKSLGMIKKMSRSNQIDFLKMDCEGCEFEVIRSGPAAAWSRVRKIAMEYHEDEERTAVELEQILRKRGFKVLKLTNRGVKGIGLIYGRRAEK